VRFVPPALGVNANRFRGVGGLVIAALATLLVMGVLALISPKAMIVAAVIAFVGLSLRFIWLVRRELQ
jgi:hypothetical protein